MRKWTLGLSMISLIAKFLVEEFELVYAYPSKRGERPIGLKCFNWIKNWLWGSHITNSVDWSTVICSCAYAQYTLKQLYFQSGIAWVSLQLVQNIEMKSLEIFFSSWFKRMRLNLRKLSKCHKEPLNRNDYTVRWPLGLNNISLNAIFWIDTFKFPLNPSSWFGRLSSSFPKLLKISQIL